MTGETDPADNSRLRALALAAGFELGLGGLGLGVWWLAGRPVALPWSLRPLNLAIGLAAVLPLLGVFLLLLRSQVPALVELRESLGHGLRTIFADSKPIDILIVSMAAGLGEELLFRGLLQAWLAHYLGPAAGILLAAVAFGLVHFLSATYAFYAALAGVYFGVLYHLTGDLTTVVVAHGLYDFIAIVYYLRGPPSAAVIR